MHFVLYCIDKTDAAQVRLDNRSAHLDFIKEWGNSVTVGGPLLADDGDGMIGSMIVLNVADRAAAERFVAGDPYGLAGLFESVTVHPYKLVIRGPE